MSLLEVDSLDAGTYGNARNYWQAEDVHGDVRAYGGAGVQYDVWAYGGVGVQYARMLP